MPEIAIHVEGLGKEFQIGGPQKVYDRLGDRLADMASAPFRRVANLVRGRSSSAADLGETIWALDAISLDIRHGETVGIIGRNGAGKSTFLKILSRITEPTRGFADIFGRVGSLLEVGTGFHPELTGRENIYLNGAILGMRRKEIDRKFDEIVAFAEIDRFIDTPVKHYSSGMYVRLAFSVAAYLEPEILLVDEVLAVGDVAFQRKCLGKMDDVAQEGRTVLFVSHNMGVMQTLCKRGILLTEGKVECDGPISTVIDTYLESLEQHQSVDLAARTDRRGLGKVRLDGIEISTPDGTEKNIIRTGGTVQFRLHVDHHLPGLDVNFTLLDQIGQAVVKFRSRDMGPNDRLDSADRQTFICEIDPFLVLPGRYRVDVGVVADNRLQDYLLAAAIINVAEGLVDGRTEGNKNEVNVTMPHRWILPPR